MFKITVFVPTYNREKLLPKLYNSLLIQTFKDFELLIIDDGSTDNTRKLVDSWHNEGIIKIRYFHQNNSGKHIAYNKAIREANSELFVELDSDDYLMPDALSIIYNQWSSIADKHLYAGLQCLCSYENGNIIGYPFKRKVTNNFELRYIDKVKGDKGMIYQTSKLKNFSFPEIRNEIVPESILHNRISLNLLTLCIQEHLIVKQYCAGGLTNQKKTIYSSINSKIILFNELNYYKLPFNIYLLVNSRYVKLSLLNGYKSKYIFTKSINKKIYFLLAFILGWVSYIKELK